jgi:serralysin
MRRLHPCCDRILPLMRWGLLPGLLTICLLLGLDWTPAQAAPLPAIPYVSFQGETLSLYPWYGDKIVLLTRSGSLDEQAIAGIVAGIDAAYTQYHAITGREPTPWGPTFINGRSTIAEVPDGHTCGAGCAYVGFTGIEIMSTYFGVLYDGYVQHGQYDQIPFYELGRNFWFYGDHLAAAGFDPFLTGFAIANRFISMELAGVPGGPFGSLDFATFKRSIVVDLLTSYLADPSLNWENTLKTNQAPPNPYGWGAADLAGGMLYRVFQDNGLSGYHDFFAALALQPRAGSAADAVNNFIQAAYTATGRDYTYLFVKTHVTCPLQTWPQLPLHPCGMKPTVSRGVNTSRCLVWHLPG